MRIFVMLPLAMCFTVIEPRSYVTGVVLRLANQVYLRPEDVAEQVIQVPPSPPPPSPLSTKLSPLHHASKYMQPSGTITIRREGIAQGRRSVFCQPRPIADDNPTSGMHGRPQRNLLGYAPLVMSCKSFYASPAEADVTVLQTAASTLG